jgi:formate hydrogenlyase subunit 4
MMEVVNFFFSTLVFPGMLFVSLFGLLYIGIDRKLTAHMQNRIGQPIWQEFLDFGKLMGKEDITPSAAQSLVFNAAPLIALGTVVTVMRLRIDQTLKFYWTFAAFLALLSFALVLVVP